MFGILLQQAQHLMDICATEDDEDEADETKASELETIASWQQGERLAYRFSCSWHVLGFEAENNRLSIVMGKHML